MDLTPLRWVAAGAAREGVARCAPVGTTDHLVALVRRAVDHPVAATSGATVVARLEDLAPAVRRGRLLGAHDVGGVPAGLGVPDVTDVQDGLAGGLRADHAQGRPSPHGPRTAPHTHGPPSGHGHP